MCLLIDCDHIQWVNAEKPVQSNKGLPGKRVGYMLLQLTHYNFAMRLEKKGVESKLSSLQEMYQTYQNEMSLLESNPRAYILESFELTSRQEACLRKHPDEFFDPFSRMIRYALENNIPISVRERESEDANAMGTSITISAQSASEKNPKDKDDKPAQVQIALVIVNKPPKE